MRGISRLAEQLLASEGLNGEFSAVLIYFAEEAWSQLYGVSWLDSQFVSKYQYRSALLRPSNTVRYSTTTYPACVSILIKLRASEIFLKN